MGFTRVAGIAGAKALKVGDADLSGPSIISQVARKQKITEDELRDICRSAAGMFIDETGYIAGVLTGVQRKLGDGKGITMTGGPEAKLRRWKNELSHSFEGAGVDVFSVVYEELARARDRQELSALSTDSRSSRQ